MARAALTPLVVTRAGLTTATPASSDHTNGTTMANDGNTWVEVTNADSVSRTVTFEFNLTVDGSSVTPVVHTLTAALVKRYGPFPVASYGGRLLIDTEVDLVKLAAYKLSS